MTPTRALALAAALAALSGAAACRSSGPQAVASPGAASTADLEALYRARVDSALSRYVPADGEFMRRMIAHHAQALEMAALAPERAASPDVRTLARRIAAGQQAEIGLMSRWLEERGLVGAGAHEHGAGSPGMLTPAQMQELERAGAGSFDRLFLAYMIQHHEGAVEMVDDLFATPGAAQDASTFRIASGVQVDQVTEIARMQSMLEALAEPGRAP
jgi:uncharacterized protein (DUF305 family)